MTDSISAAEERSLRAQLNAMERQREAHYRELDRQLAAGARKLEATRLSTTVENLRRQTADALAELHELDDEEAAAPPLPPPLPGQRNLGPEEEAARIRNTALGSEEHMRLRREHGISKPFVL